MQYRILEHANTFQLALEVEQYLKDGWKLNGPPTPYKDTLIQAVYKEWAQFKIGGG